MNTLRQQLSNIVFGFQILNSPLPLWPLLFIPKSQNPHLDPLAGTPTAIIDKTAHIEAFAWVGPGVHIGARTHVEAHVRIDGDVIIGSDCHIMAGSVVRSGSRLSDGVILDPMWWSGLMGLDL